MIRSLDMAADDPDTPTHRSGGLKNQTPEQLLPDKIGTGTGQKERVFLAMEEDFPVEFPVSLAGGFEVFPFFGKSGGV